METAAPDLLDLPLLQEAVHRSLSTWSELSSSEDELLASLLLVRQARKEEGEPANPADRRRITNHLLQEAMDELASENGVEARVLEARFVQGRITRQVASQLHASPDQVNRWQRSAIKNLAHVLLGREDELRRERIRRLEASLPAPSYDRLFGFDQARKVVVRHLTDPELAPIAVVTGIGGIGKTSLADAAVREAIQELYFDDVLWIRANRITPDGKPLPAEAMYESVLIDMANLLWPAGSSGSALHELEKQIRDTFKSHPHLLILDNLVTREGTELLLEKGQAWIVPSRLLLTSRARPTTVHPAFFHSVDELNTDDSLALLRHQAAILGLDDLAQAEEGELLAIHNVVGGNPLALKLVASLSAVLPLPQVLADLARGRPGPIEDLYRLIYWEAWRTLSPQAQALLQAMPLSTGPGALPEQMQAMSGLAEAEFWPALSELTGRSLLEVRGTVQKRRYGIHHLTDAFLRTEIIHWADS